MQSSISTSSASRHRLAPLDFLRGVAILLVLGRHHPVPPKTSGLWAYPAMLWQRFGWTGVDLFFVLSGFLIGGLLCNEIKATGTLCVRRFWVRRGFKILPAYWFYLLAMFVIVPLESGLSPDQWVEAMWLRLLPCILNVQNYYLGSMPRPHLWSLAVEEHFYLMLPFLFLLLSRRSFRNRPALEMIPVFVVGTMFVCTMLRGYASAAGAAARYVLYATHFRIDALALGVLLAYLYHFRPACWARLSAYPGRLLACAVILVTAGAWPRQDTAFSHVPGLAFVYIGCAAIVIVLMNAHTSKPLSAVVYGPVGRIISFIGVFSYSIYLWHEDTGGRLILFLCRHSWIPASLPASLTWPVLSALYIAVGAFAGILMNNLLERPVLAVRDRLFPSGYGINTSASSQMPSRPHHAPQPVSLAKSA